jgi:hypothetical protein
MKSSTFDRLSANGVDDSGEKSFAAGIAEILRRYSRETGQGRRDAGIGILAGVNFFRAGLY